MRSVNIHEAKTHLSRLVEAAARGEGFIIAKAVRPMVRVMPFGEVPVDTKDTSQRIGFMKGLFEVPDDFDRLMADDISDLFDEGPLFPDEAEARHDKSPR
jgi:antitoxin (DNA-binding transcriptional repressor) of toxin-antitoxin stability system